MKILSVLIVSVLISINLFMTAYGVPVTRAQSVS